MIDLSRPVGHLLTFSEYSPKLVTFSEYSPKLVTLVGTGPKCLNGNQVGNCPGLANHAQLLAPRTTVSTPNHKEADSQSPLCCLPLHSHQAPPRMRASLTLALVSLPAVACHSVEMDSLPFEVAGNTTTQPVVESSSGFDVCDEVKDRVLGSIQPAWYTFTIQDNRMEPVIPEDGDDRCLQVVARGAPFDPVLTVYSGLKGFFEQGTAATCVEALSWSTEQSIETDELGVSTTTYARAQSFNVQVGQAYDLAVAGSGGRSGPFILEVSVAPGMCSPSYLLTDAPTPTPVEGGGDSGTQSTNGDTTGNMDSTGNTADTGGLRGNTSGTRIRSASWTVAALFVLISSC